MLRRGSGLSYGSKRLFPEFSRPLLVGVLATRSRCLIEPPCDFQPPNPKATELQIWLTSLPEASPSKVCLQRPRNQQQLPPQRPSQRPSQRQPLAAPGFATDV